MANARYISVKHTSFVVGLNISLLPPSRHTNGRLILLTGKEGEKIRSFFGDLATVGSVGAVGQVRRAAQPQPSDVGPGIRDSLRDDGGEVFWGEALDGAAGGLDGGFDVAGDGFLVRPAPLECGLDVVDHAIAGDEIPRDEDAFDHIAA